MEAQARPPELSGKDLVRKWVWDEMEARDLARFPRPCHGRIPNFVGSKTVPDVLAAQPAYRAARAVFIGPDLALKACRDRVLADGKILAYATPRMREFKELHPEGGCTDSSIRSLKRYGDPLETPVSVILVGSVAVDLEGNRIGKGAGYGDREIAWLRERGLIEDGAVRMTAVHPIQVFDDLAPLMEPTDERVDIILTPGEACPVT